MTYRVFLIPGWPDKMNSRTVTDLQEKLNKYADKGYELDKMNGPLVVMVKTRIIRNLKEAIAGAETPQ